MQAVIAGKKLVPTVVDLITTTYVAAGTTWSFCICLSPKRATKGFALPPTLSLPKCASLRLMCTPWINHYTYIPSYMPERSGRNGHWESLLGKLPTSLGGGTIGCRSGWVSCPNLAISQLYQPGKGGFLGTPAHAAVI